MRPARFFYHRKFFEMSNARAIKSRIRSAKNTSKITKALELVSTVKMKKTADAALGARPFLLEALGFLASLPSMPHTRYSPRPQQSDADTSTKKHLILVVTSDRGLCGAYNAAIFRALGHMIEGCGIETYDFAVMGKKGRRFVEKHRGNIVADFSEDIPARPSFDDIRPIARFLRDRFSDACDFRVDILSARYVSTMEYRVKKSEFLPIDSVRFAEFFYQIDTGTPEKIQPIDATIEPNLSSMVESFLPIALDAMLFEVILSARSAEHASRMIAMKSASDNAKQKAASLSLDYHKARQASITQEVSEIVSGMESQRESF